MKPEKYTSPEPQADSSPEPTLEAELKSALETDQSFVMRTDSSSGPKPEPAGPEPLNSSSNICNKVEKTEKLQESRKLMNEDRKNEIRIEWVTVKHGWD